MIIKSYKEVVCDICGEEIEHGRDNVTIKGKRFITGLVPREYTNAYKIVSKQFDMCSKCLNKFKDYVRYQVDED